MPNSTPAGSSKQTRQTRSTRAELVFPVGRVQRMLKGGRYAERIGSTSSVYLASVLEYMVSEVIELAGNATHDSRKLRITPRHLMLAVRGDDELNRLFEHVIIAQAGVVPTIHSALLPQKARSNNAQPTAGPSGLQQQIVEDDEDEEDGDYEEMGEEHDDDDDEERSEESED